MSWLSEKEYRQAGAEAIGVTINVAFLKEIKADYSFRDLLTDTYFRLSNPGADGWVKAHQAAELLSDLRDELETYFALEECYGYFNDAATSNPTVGLAADDLRREHTELFQQLDELVEWSLQIAYQEISGPENTIGHVFAGLENFCKRLAKHEQAEMDLMMRLCNEDIGVGD